MIRFIYNFFLIVLVVGLAPFWGAVVLGRGKYRRTVAGRLGWGLERRLRSLPRSGPRIWVHALSVGEVRSAVPLVRTLKEKRPEAVVVLTAATASGLAAAQGAGADLVLPFPFDLPPVVARFLSRVRPELFILVETDFWPNILAGLARRQVPAYLVNGRISERSLARYRRFGFFFRPLFSSFAALVLQNEEDVERLATLEIASDRLFAVGNLKYDAAIGAPPAAVDLPPGRYVVAGSTHTGEDPLILDCLHHWRAVVPDLRLVLVPRHVDRAAEIVTLAERRGFTTCSYPPGDDNFDVLVVDVFGKLAGLYQRAEVAFIGGSLVERGGHNPIEAAVFGVPVIFGPHTEDFVDITRDFLAEEAAVMVRDGGELCQVVADFLADEARRRRIGEQGLRLVQRHRGAAQRIVDLVFRGEP